MMRMMRTSIILDDDDDEEIYDSPRERERKA